MNAAPVEINRSAMPGKTSRALAVLAPLLIFLACAAAYSNSFDGPFIFDDPGSIVHNETIRRLWPPWKALSPPPGGETISGRPLLNYSMALNYAVGRTNVRGYHALNLLIHLCAAFAFFGLLRRTLRRPPLAANCNCDATVPALCAALLWALHPLQTESVTYIVQRAESLVGLFYLLTLYCFARALDTGRRRWLFLSAAAAMLGAGCKEVIATAPLAVLFFDRCFGAGTFRGALRRRWRFYLCLTIPVWLAVGWTIVSTGGRGGTAGLGQGVPPIMYAKIQCWAIVTYLKLALWPHPLILDYGRGIDIGSRYIAPAVILAALLLLSALALWRNSPAGFAAAFFFLVLGPSSSFVPVVTEVVAEHRMYLPLASVLCLIALSLYRLASRRGLARFAAAALLAWAAALGAATHARNFDYGTAMRIWQDCANKAPWNPRAWLAAGNVWLNLNNAPMAVPFYDKALQLFGEYPEALTNKGICLTILSRPAEAAELFAHSERIDAESVENHYHFGHALMKLGRHAEAIHHFERALKLKPKYADAEYSLGDALMALGRTREAVGHFLKTLELHPRDAEAHLQLGAAYAKLSDAPAARKHYEAALTIAPNSEPAKDGLRALEENAKPK